jgi:hypothetical protein
MPLMKFAFTLSLLFPCFLVLAQQPIHNNRYYKPYVLVNLTWKPVLPAGDLANRYTLFNGVGMDVYFKTKKNYTWGINSSFFFGRSVKDIAYLDFMKDKNGYVFTDDGQPVNILASMRGSHLQLAFGKLIQFYTKIPEWSFLVQGGIGILQHKYLFQAANTLQLSSTYLRGYDRLRNGLAISEEAGICHFNLNRRVNFNTGIELTEAFTKNRRYYDYATQSVDDKSYFDMMIAVKVSWILPVKVKDKNEPVYYR